MPYGYLILVATVILALRHFRSAHASNQSKYLVGGAAAFSVLAPYLYPRFLPMAGWVGLVSMVLQLAICGYLIFYQAVYEGEPDMAVHHEVDAPGKSSVADQ